MSVYASVWKDWHGMRGKEMTTGNPDQDGFKIWSKALLQLAKVGKLNLDLMDLRTVVEHQGGATLNCRYWQCGRPFSGCGIGQTFSTH